MNDGPVAVAATNVATEDAAALVTGQLVSNDADVLGKTATYTLDTAVAGLTVNPDGSYSFNPGNAAYQNLAAGETRDVVANFTVTDDQNAVSHQTLTITVTGVNDGPVAVAATNVAKEDAAVVTGQLVSSDADVLGKTATYTLDAPVAGLTISTNGSYSFNPGNTAYQNLAAGETRNVVANFTVTDDQNAVSRQTLTITVTGTNDVPVVGTDVKNLVESDSSASISASGTITVTDKDAGESQTQTSTQVGNYGTFAINDKGVWTYTASSAHNELKVGEKVQETFTVTSADGTKTNTVTINITGTNDVPVLSELKSVTFIQGGFATDLAKASATDAESTSIRYAFSSGNDEGIFAIDSGTGQVSLVNASSVAWDAESYYDLVITATDVDNGVSTPQTLRVNIDMAVEGNAASLPGGIDSWTVAPVTGAQSGYVFTNITEPSIKVFVPTGVNSIVFAGGGSLGLDANGTIIDTTTTIDHTIRITEGAEVGDEVVLSTSNAKQVTVIGQANSAVTDGVKIATDINVNNLDAIFSVVDASTIRVGGVDINPIKIAGVGTGNALIADVEYVQFNNAKVLIVGAGGYATLSAASAAAQSGDMIFVSKAALANGDAGMINNTTDISIYIAQGDEAVNMTMLNAGQQVRIYGSHAFTLNGSSGNDTVHDYTTLAAGKTNYIYGMDGADTLVSHSNDAGKHILSGGSGADKMIGGTGAQLLGGDGNDTLLSFGGAAILSGGAGDDILLNAYGSSDGKTAVNMIGGSGIDTFGLIGSSDTAQTGVMKTVVTDLGTGDKIDLSFVEGVKGGIDTAADFTKASANNKATMTTAGTTLTFDSSVVATSSEDDADANTQMQAGSLVLSNATLTKVSAAMTAGKDSLTGSVPDFSTAFTPLTDTYNHHG